MGRRKLIEKVPRDQILSTDREVLAFLVRRRVYPESNYNQTLRRVLGIDKKKK